MSGHAIMIVAAENRVQGHHHVVAVRVCVLDSLIRIVLLKLRNPDAHARSSKRRAQSRRAREHKRTCLGKMYGICGRWNPWAMKNGASMVVFDRS